jgi:3-oxoacyl-[acyl-carrier-protein] synthase III
MVQALQLAVQDAGVSVSELDTLIALPSLMSEQHFMIGHAVAQQVRVSSVAAVCLSAAAAAAAVQPEQVYPSLMIMPKIIRSSFRLTCD